MILPKMEFITDNLVKSTGTYRCPDDIRNFKIRLRIQEGSPNEIAGKHKGRFKEKEFFWQEKRFSKAQKEFYRDERNCFTDLEKKFHNMVCEDVEENDNDFLFSYVNEEDFCSENEGVTNRNYLKRGASDLNIDVSAEEHEYNFQVSLQKSINSPYLNTDSENMYLLADFGEYFGDTWIKNERLLCTLKYNPEYKVLHVLPDFTTTYPYSLKVQNDDERLFCYFIENSSNNIPESLETNEKTLIKKVHDYQASARTRLVTETFKLPTKNKLNVFVFLEISSGKRFEYPEVYVQYYINLPEGWSSSHSDYLIGRTHICRAINEDGLVHFGHCVDVLLEYTFKNLEHAEFPKLPHIYFEVISKDSWGRYRTEGLCYVNLPVSLSGTFKYNLLCYRFTTKSPVGEMKRFFIGDCRNYSDVTLIGFKHAPETWTDFKYVLKRKAADRKSDVVGTGGGPPKVGSLSDFENRILNILGNTFYEGLGRPEYGVNIINKCGTETVNTGELNLRMSLIHQSQEFLEDDDLNRTRKTAFEKLGSSTLIKSVEQVIQEFKKARKDLLEARKNI